MKPIGQKRLSHTQFTIVSLIVCLSAVQYCSILYVSWYVAPGKDESSIPNTPASMEKTVFDGTFSFLALLRKEYDRKIINPRPHCITTSSVANIQKKVRRFNRAVEVDWVGRNISSVNPTWSSNETASCHFAALEFPPTSKSLDKAVNEVTYHSSFYTPAQCEARNWNLHLMDTCEGNNWGGTLGSMSKDICVKESSWGYPVHLWAQKHLHGEQHERKPLHCIEILLEYDSTPEEASLNIGKLHSVAASIDEESFVKKLMSRDFTMGYGTTTDWNFLIFKEYSSEVLNSFLGNSSASKQTIDTLEQLGDGFKQDRVSKCIEELIPYPHNYAGESATKIHQYRYWKKYGVHLEKSSMKYSVSSILKSLPGSLRNVLPPPPTAIYAVNAILSKVIHVPSEAYIPGCAPYWNAVNGSEHVAMLSEEKKLLNSTSLNFREEILHICSTNQRECPFPTYDLVLSVEQVYCGEFFHFVIEIWGRIAPFLDGLMAEDMPKFAIRPGCSAAFHKAFYFDLMGLDKEKVLILGNDETVFAKEVIMPTEGFSHSPLFNYWNLVAARYYVRKNFVDIIGKGQNTLQKTVILIMRDAGRRKDTNVYTEQFLQLLDEGLPQYNVTAHRASDKDLMRCLRCQVEAFVNADVIIGSHGAGLSHILFAKRGAVILERIVSKRDSGIYAEIPYILGMKYFPMEATAGADAYRDIILFADTYK